jgi:putative SOS response-associated peptidase YedK
MCGRYTIATPADVIAEVFGVDEPIELAPRYNVCPGQDVPVVRTRQGADDRTIDLLRWGLVPWFAQEPGPAARMINARSETAAESPAFRDALRRRRCLLPADGFFEWQGERGTSQVAGTPRRRKTPKQPFYIHRADHAPLALAGLWERWQGPDGQRIESCTILTTTPNALLRELHDRMPVILPRDAWATWLDRTVQDVARIQELLVAAPEKDLVAAPVSTWVNDFKHDDPRCIAPLA